MALEGLIDNTGCLFIKRKRPGTFEMVQVCCIRKVRKYCTDECVHFGEPEKHTISEYAEAALKVNLNLNYRKVYYILQLCEGELELGHLIDERLDE